MKAGFELKERAKARAVPEIKWQQPQNREERHRVSGILKMSQAHIPPCLRSAQVKLLTFFPITFLPAPLCLGGGASSPQGEMEKRPKVDLQSWDVWVLQVRVRLCLTGNLRFSAA